MFELKDEKVNCMVRETIPSDEESILDIIDLGLTNSIEKIRAYERPKDVCPFGRGNKVIDIHLVSGAVNRVKLPIEMTDEQVKKFCKPLLDHLEEGNKKYRESMN